MSHRETSTGESVAKFNDGNGGWLCYIITQSGCQLLKLFFPEVTSFLKIAIKFANGMDFRNNSICLLATGKTFILSEALPWECSFLFCQPLWTIGKYPVKITIIPQIHPNHIKGTKMISLSKDLLNTSLNCPIVPCLRCKDSSSQWSSCWKGLSGSLKIND